MTRLLSCFLLCFCMACQHSPTAFELLIGQQTEFDLAIVGGMLVDGSGNPGYAADILVSDGKIAFIGAVDLSQVQVNDTIVARGKIVSPGFIDVHTHGNPLNGGSFENFLASGVTTIFLGQDGYHPSLPGHPYNLSAWMDSLERSPLELNVAMMAGHGSLRRSSGVKDDAQPTAAELSFMMLELDELLDLGCYGLSTGLEYVPGMYAQETELRGLADIVGSKQAVMASHIRNEDDDQVESSINELLRLGDLCKVHVSHIKVVYGKGLERAKEILDLIDSAKSKGAEVSADVYPYTASYTGIGIVFPPWAKTQEQFEAAMKPRKQELRQYLHDRIIKRNGPEATLFGSGPYAGKTLAQAASDQGQDFVDLLLELGPEGASGAYFIMDEALQDVFIKHPEIMIASDGSPTMLHPRGHGSQSRIIEKYVVQQAGLPIEQAIYKMTGLPAQTMGMSTRGLLQQGMAADILVFEPEMVHEKATYANPYQLAEGFEQVIVNGILVRTQHGMTHRNAGRLLRRSK